MRIKDEEEGERVAAVVSNRGSDSIKYSSSSSSSRRRRRRCNRSITDNRSCSSTY